MRGRRKTADDASGADHPRGPSAEEKALSARLRHLGDQLDRHRASSAQNVEPSTRSSVDTAGMARGMRLSSELIAGVLVGAVIGWLLDRWLGISPFGLIVFLLLGFAAGVLNVMRSAGVAPGGR